MKYLLVALLLIGSPLHFFAQKEPKPDTLFRICLDETLEPEGKIFPTCGYVNRNGDTIIPVGKYFGILEGDFVYFTSVFLNEGDCINGNCGPFAVDRNGNILFEIYWYDNGPDYVSDGLVRIVENDLIGYADEKGNIVIKPQYTCAWPFENGKAMVATDCRKEQMDDEHWAWRSEHWMTINKRGKVIRTKKAPK